LLLAGKLETQLVAWFPQSGKKQKSSKKLLRALTAVALVRISMALVCLSATYLKHRDSQDHQT